MTAILMCLQEMPVVDKNIGTKFPLRTIFIRDALEHFHCYVQPRSTWRGASVYMHHRKRSSFFAHVGDSFHSMAKYTGTRSLVRACLRKFDSVLRTEREGGQCPAFRRSRRAARTCPCARVASGATDNPAPHAKTP